MFDIAIQTGAIIAVVLVYWQRLVNVAGSLGSSAAARRFVANVLIGFLPAAVLGVLVYKAIKAYLFNGPVVATSFIVGGLIILWAERRDHAAARIVTVDAMTPLDALKVGLVQCLGMIPGTSRSGATIIGGMLLGLSRQAATEFSFFRCADVLGRLRVLVPVRVAVRPLAAALHRDAHLHPVRVVPHRLRCAGAADPFHRLGGLGRLNQRRLNTRSHTPWPSRWPRASNFVSGRCSGRGA